MNNPASDIGDWWNDDLTPAKPLDIERTTPNAHVVQIIPTTDAARVVLKDFWEEEHAIDTAG